MMNKSKKYIAIAFVVVLIVVVIVSTVGILSLKNKPEILQGQAEATEIRISGKLPGRIDKFLVEEGQDVLKGDTLVVINSPEIVAKYDQVDAIKNAAVYENQKIEEGTRKQIVESAYQLWMKSKSDLELATTTYNRISSLYRDSVVTSQRKDETEAIYKAALAGERAAFQQYQMALDGARKQDRESSQSMVDAARSTVQEVAALLQDARLTAPESGQIAVIYPKRGELVGPGTPIMSLVVLEDAHVVLNVREDLMPHFRMKGKFKGDVPALARKGIEFEIYYISPLGSYSTWKSTKQVGSYDMRTFEIKARPTAPLDRICALAEKYDALVMVDECHSAGVLGETGRGITELYDLRGQVDILTGTLGKAFGGAVGGFTTGRREIIDMLRQRSRPYLFSNSLPPAVVGAGIETFKMLAESHELHDRLVANVEHFRAGMMAAGFDIKPTQSAICAVMLYDAKLSQEFAAKLQDEGVFVTGFYYPVVPKGQARIRVQVSAGHTIEQLDRCIAAFTKVGKELNVIK